MLLIDGKGYTDIHPSTLRLSDQYQEVLPRANIDFRNCRGDSWFCGNDFEPFQRENPKSTESMQGNTRKRESNRQETKQTDSQVSHKYFENNLGGGKGTAVMVGRELDSVQ